MVTAILPNLTDDSNTQAVALCRRSRKPTTTTTTDGRASRDSVALSLSSELTITPERYTRAVSASPTSSEEAQEEDKRLGKPSALAGYVGLFTGCGALVALSLFLPLPARFGEIDGVSTADAVTYSFYVVALVSLVVAVFVSFGLRGLKGEDGKGWKVLFGVKRVSEDEFADGRVRVGHFLFLPLSCSFYRKDELIFRSC